jgi:hypothetical protein
MDYDRDERLERCRELAISYETFGFNDTVRARMQINARVSEFYGAPVPAGILVYLGRKETREERMLRLWEAHVAHPQHVRD